jgi:hypothetical protein
MAQRVFLFNLVSLKNQRRQTGSIQEKTGMAHRGDDKMALIMAIDSNAKAVGLVCSMINVLGNKYEQTGPDLWPTSGSRTN